MRRSIHSPEEKIKTVIRPMDHDTYTPYVPSASVMDNHVRTKQFERIMRVQICVCAYTVRPLKTSTIHTTVQARPAIGQTFTHHYTAVYVSSLEFTRLLDVRRIGRQSFYAFQRPMILRKTIGRREEEGGLVLQNIILCYFHDHDACLSRPLRRCFPGLTVRASRVNLGARQMDTLD